MFLNRYCEVENERSSVRDAILRRSNVGAVDYGNIGMLSSVPSFPMRPPPPGIFHMQIWGDTTGMCLIQMLALAVALLSLTTCIISG